MKIKTSSKDWERSVKITWFFLGILIGGILSFPLGAYLQSRIDKDIIMAETARITARIARVDTERKTLDDMVRSIEEYQAQVAHVIDHYRLRYRELLRSQREVD